MKHVPLYILLAFLSAAAFSCMGDSEDTTMYYQRLGVVQADPAQTIKTVDSYFITSPAFAGMQEGECYRVDFNASLPEFPQGTVDVEVLRIDTVPVWPFDGAFTDTSLILPGEVRLKSVKINKQNNYLDGRLFVYTTRDSFFLNETAVYDLSYNWNEEKVRDASGNYVYDLFLRLTQTGGMDTIRAAGTLYTNAFILQDFLRQAAAREQSAGKDSVIMRMNFAQSYNRDSTAWTWSVTDTFALRVAGYQ